MKTLKDRILKDGKCYPGGILKVDNFINHQMDPILMKSIGVEFVRRFASTSINKIITVEASAGAIARELLGLCPAFDCLDEYRARCFVPGHWVTVCTGTESYAAKAVVIDDAGRLIVQREGGRTEALCHGEVSIRPSPLAVK